MESAKATIAVFTGTGNTLLMAALLAEELQAGGVDASLASMTHPDRFRLPEDSALGLAVPVACFSTYPTVWRFIDALPEGRGREAFFLATMGGLSLGMEGPVREVVAGKGYRPVGAAVVTMPGNYNNKTMPVAENEKRTAAAEEAVKRYARTLLEGGGSTAGWRGGGILPSFFARFAHSKRPWRLFYRMFPLAVDPQKCTGCGLCAELCPEGNIDMFEGMAIIRERCQSCQRCCGFCPVSAISVPGKPAVPYRSISLEDLRALEGAGA